MEDDDEDDVNGTELQKYLNAVGHSDLKFEICYQNNIEKLGIPKSYTSEPKCIKKIIRSTKNHMKDFGLCLTLIKIILESQLIFKEDTSFIREFIPSDYIEYPTFLTKQNGLNLFLLCIFCGLLNVFLPKYCDEWTAVGILLLWLGYVFMKILYSLNQNRIITKTIFKTIESMKKSSMLIQKTTNFLHECNNLHSLYNRCNYTYTSKNANAFIYLLMPELKNLLLTVIQDLINNLLCNISEVHTFFPLKDSVSNIVYLYLTDCKIDLENISLENINKAKYTYFLLQSEFLKQSALCFCPVLWTPNSSLQMNRLIETIDKIEKVYSNSYEVLYEEYNIYSLFKNNKVKQNKYPVKDTNTSDLKLKICSVRQFLQNMMVHVKFMEDSIEDNTSTYCDDNINSTLNVLVKEVNVFNELISKLQIYYLRTSNDDHKNKANLTNDPIEVVDHTEQKIIEPVKAICEDELFFGVSEEITEEVDNKCCDEEIFDKSNNHNLMLELKVALKNKQEEWKQRENKLIEKHPLLNDLSEEEEECNEKQNEYINKVRKIAIDLPPDERFPMQLPSKSFADEIAMVACKWNTEIKSFGDDSDSDMSRNSNDS